MKQFSPHLDILPPAQKKLWPKLSFTKEMGFCLYGGTALALQLGHRESVDFDFFSDRSFFGVQLLEKLPITQGVEVRQCSQNTLSFIIDGVGMSFFGHQSYGRVGEPLLTNDNNIFVASLLDIFGLKLKVLFDRIEWKDYYDIAALLRHGISLKDGLCTAKAFFGKAFLPEHCLMALTYFEGLDLEKLNMADRELLINRVQEISHPITASKILSSSLIPSDYQTHKNQSEKHRIMC